MLTKTQTFVNFLVKFSFSVNTPTYLPCHEKAFNLGKKWGSFNDYLKNLITRNPFYMLPSWAKSVGSNLEEWR